MRMKSYVSVLIGLFVLTGCGSFKHQFAPPLQVENDRLEMSVREIQKKGKRLRVWVDLVNKTDKVLVLSYGDFRAESEGVSVAGALRVPFVRVRKGFEMPAKMHKHVRQPIEFVGLRHAPEVTMTITNVRTKGEDGSFDLGIKFPVDLLKER